MFMYVALIFQYILYANKFQLRTWYSNNILLLHAYIVTSCMHVHQYDHTVFVIIEPQKPSNVTVVMPLIHNSYDTADVLNITLEWNDESNSFPLKRRNHIFNYTITAQCSEAADSESIIFYTADTSIPLTLHYDRDYNISVVANNCVGNSTPAEIHIRLGRPHGIARLREPEYYITAMITLFFCTLCIVYLNSLLWIFCWERCVK